FIGWSCTAPSSPRRAFQHIARDRDVSHAFRSIKWQGRNIPHAAQLLIWRGVFVNGATRPSRLVAPPSRDRFSRSVLPRSHIHGSIPMLTSTCSSVFARGREFHQDESGDVVTAVAVAVVVVLLAAVIALYILNRRPRSIREVLIDLSRSMPPPSPMLHRH